MNVKQRDIVIMPYPFSNLKETKIRPGLIVSNDRVNNKGNDCIIVPLTTVIKDMPHSFFITQQNLSSGFLIRPSCIRVDKVFCIEKRKIIKKIGVLREETFSQVKELLYNIF